MNRTALHSLSRNVPAGGRSEPVGACARGETEGLRRAALDLATDPTREAPDDLA